MGGRPRRLAELVGDQELGFAEMREPLLKPAFAMSFPATDRFELFYWSNVNGRWRTFGNLGRMKLMLQSAHEIVESDPMFRIPRA